MGARCSTSGSTIGFSVTEFQEDKDLTKITISDLYPTNYEIRFNGFAFRLARAPVTDWFEDTAYEIFHMCYLNKGWDGYNAPEINRECIFDAIRLLSEVIQENTPKPFVFPTATGGIQIEWHTETADLEIEVITQSEIIILFTDSVGREQDCSQSLFEDVSNIISAIKNLGNYPLYGTEHNASKS